MGRPAHQPSVESRAIVWEMTAFGVPQERVARAMSISVDTLADNYRDELDAATDEAVTQVGKNLFSKALGDGRESMTAAIFFLKTRGKWRETDKQEPGENAGTITIRWEDDRDRPAISSKDGSS